MIKKSINRLLIISAITLCEILPSVFAQVPEVEWIRSYGGSSYDLGYSVKQTSDGGFIVVGSTESNGAGSKDVWLIRTNPSGDVLWSKTFGESGFDVGSSVRQNTDGGFIIVGETRSFNADSTDILLIRTDSLGNLIWLNTYGGLNVQVGTDVQQTSNGGFIVSGYKVTDSLSHSNAILLKVNGLGTNVQLFQFDSGDFDYATSVVQNNSGGFAFTGNSKFSSTDYNIWLVVTDPSGNIISDRTYGGSESEYGSSIIYTNDGGYAIGGTTFSFGAGGADFWLVRTNNSGDTLWTKTYGGPSTELLSSICQTYDGGFIMTGYTSSFGFGGSTDLWLVRTNNLGDTLWTKSVGGSSYERGFSVQTTTDSGFIVTGYTTSNGASDVYLVRLKNNNQTTGIEVDEDLELTTFKLFQNYPNPFNPSTKIRFSIPNVGTGLALTVLKVYDVLGNEIAALVNEYKEAGTYEIDFNANQLSSGIYFYTLSTGSFIETKKMILLR